jgi:hypothetical protein
VRFTRTNMTGSRIGVLVTTCTTCGQLDLWLAGKYLGRVNSHASATHPQQVLWLPAVTRRTGTLLIRTVTRNTVLLDGVLAIR